MEKKSSEERLAKAKAEAKKAEAEAEARREASEAARGGIVTRLREGYFIV